MSGASLRVLVARLIDEGKAYAAAELAVAKARVRSWLTLAKIVVPLVVVAVVVAQAAVIILIAAFGLWLARWLGTAGGLAVAGLLALAIVGIVLRTVMVKLSRVNR